MHIIAPETSLGLTIRGPANLARAWSAQFGEEERSAQPEHGGT